MDLDQILPRVQKPVRYIGGERNAIERQPRVVKVRMTLAFPDLYEIGSSRDLCGERVFRPWPDMEGGLRRAGLPLISLETFTTLTPRRDRILPAVRVELHQHPDDVRSEPPAAAQHGSRRGRSADHRRRARGTERRPDRGVLRPAAPGSGAVSRQAMGGRLPVLSGRHHLSSVAVVSGIHGAGAASMRIARAHLLTVGGRDLVSPLALGGRP